MQNLPPWSWLLIAALYFVCPFDFDVVPILGWVDDWLVVYLCYQKWRKGNQVEQSELTLPRPETRSTH